LLSGVRGASDIHTGNVRAVAIKTNQHLHESVSCSSFCLKNAASLVRESRRGRR